MGRILGDQGDLAGAFDAWAEALRVDPMRIGALKGIGFLYFKAGDIPAAMEHLSRAADIDPDDPSIHQAIQRIRSIGPEAQRAPATVPKPQAAEPQAVAVLPAKQPDPPASPALASNGHQAGVLLVDGNGLRLNGSLLSPGNEDVSDRVAAELAGVSKEATRTSRLLKLGTWQAIAVESPEGNLFLVPPTPETLLLTVRDASLPMARLGLLADRAARDAREWLAQHT